jgi:hypothetical protein
VNTGRCLGKLAPRRDARTLRFASYVKLAALPPAPPARDWSSKAAPAWGMMRNDELGDCTCAAAGHLIQAWTANHGAEVTPDDDAIVAAYSAITGYTPSDPSTDQGGVELDVLNYWRSTGIAGQKIGAYASVDALSMDHVKAAINCFGGVYLGAALPLAAQNQTIWDVGGDGDQEPGSWGGHAMAAVGYTPAGVVLVTWGATKFATWVWWAKYVDESYALLDDAWVNGSTPAPSGFDLAALQADLAAVGAVR